MGGGGGETRREHQGDNGQHGRDGYRQETGEGRPLERVRGPGREIRGGWDRQTTGWCRGSSRARETTGDKGAGDF